MKRVAVLLASCVVACGGETDPLAPPTGATETVRVEVAAVAREQIVEKIVGTGTIAAHKTTDIGPRVSGIINEIPVKVGDRVEEGAVLFRTRSDDYEIRARQAAAQARIARAALQKLERDVERIERLQAQGVASVERLDDVRVATRRGQHPERLALRSLQRGRGGAGGDGNAAGPDRVAEGPRYGSRGRG